MRDGFPTLLAQVVVAQEVAHGFPVDSVPLRLHLDLEPAPL